MKKLLTLALMLCLGLPAHAEEAKPEAKATKDQIRNLVKILLPEAQYVDEKSKVLTRIDSMLDEQFGCIKMDSPLQKKIHEKVEAVFSYDTAVDDLMPLFGDFTSQDVLKVLEFYDSETGTKWVAASGLLPGVAKSSGTALGNKVVQEVIPLLAEDKVCGEKIMQKMKAAHKEAGSEEGKKHE